MSRFLSARSPLPVPDLVALYNATTRLSRLGAAAAILQAARSESIGWYLGDTLLAAFLLYPLELDELDHREALFTVHPQAAPHMKRIMRQARLIVGSLPDDVLLTGHADTEAGARIFRLAGFTSAGGNIFEWRRHGGIRRQHEEAVCRRGHLRAGRADRARA